MKGIVLRGSFVASILAMLLGIYIIYDAHQKMRAADNAVSAQAALQAACGGDSACITNQSFDWIDDTVAAFDAEKQIQQGRYVLYVGLGVLFALALYFLFRWVITGKLRSQSARDEA